MSANILLLPGDGVGPEIVAQAELCINELQRLNFLSNVVISNALIGGVAIDATGSPLPDDTIEAVRRADAVLLGAVGAPQYDSLPAEQKPEKGLLNLRRLMGVFANLRPAKCHSCLAYASSLRPDLVENLDILIVRELTGGIYFGEPRGIANNGNVNNNNANKCREAYNTMRYNEEEITRVARIAFEIAQQRQNRLCSVDKANVLEVSMLWREVITDLGAKEYPDVALSHMYVDNAAMQLIRNPKQFDTIVTGNLFGDILSDAAAMLTGSIGMLPSASLNNSGIGLYEPVHGSAPDIAGQDVANPLATLLSVEMMLRYSLAASDAADHLAKAIKKTLSDGARTRDIAADGDTVIGCKQMGQHVIKNLAL